MSRSLANLSIFVLLFIPSIMTAQGGYILLEPLSEPYNVAITDGGSIADYVNEFVRMIVAGATVLAVVVIVYGGFLYATARDDAGQVTDGVNHIKDAIYGLLLLLSAYIILYTVNPQLVDLKLNLGQLGQGAGGGEGGGVTPGGGGATRVMSDQTIRAGLQNIEQYNEFIDQMAAQYGIPKERIQAIIIAESNGNPNAQNARGGAYGLMQLQPATARAMAVGDASLMERLGGANASPSTIAQRLMSDPTLNIELGTRYYNRALTAVGRENYDAASVYYNSGNTLGLRPSNEPDCARQGLLVWQCPLNQGYSGTRSYIPNINNTVRIIRGQ